jgi:YD repeat-containing protein
VTPASGVLPASSRKVSTQWHPDWVLPSKQAEPGKITTSIYNGQPDPFNGGAVASCAPSTALLPDGKPIAVLCKQVEQATTDTDGHLGFSAGLQSGVANRTSSWTYNQYGQVLTEDGPRTDVNDITTYTYYGDTSFTGEGAAAQGHFIGDLQSVTNATGKVTSYGKYNKHGQLLESSDANGVLTVNTYDLRQRLLSSSVGGQTTSYSYDAAGQLKKVTLPDSSWVGYDYDDAHRQVAVYDNKGNRTEYQLDNAGNRTGETTKDPSGNLKRQLSRSIDALGRVQQATGRE